MKKYIIDIEASGLEKESYPIEIAFVDLESSEAFSFLIKPYSHWTHWNEQAEKVHNISQSELLKNGSNPYEVAENVFNLLSQSQVFSDAYQFDSHWLNTLLLDSGFPEIVVQPVHDLISDQNVFNFNYSLNELKTPHRALQDCLMIKECILKYI